MKTFEEALKTAKNKYADAIRGKEYQDYMLSLCIFGSEDYENYSRRKSVYVQDIALLEDIFGTELLQSEQAVKPEKPTLIYKVGQKVWYVDDFYCTPDIKVLQCTIKSKDCCKLRLIDSNNYFLDVDSSSKRLFDNPDEAHSKCSQMIENKSNKIRNYWRSNK